VRLALAANDVTTGAPLRLGLVISPSCAPGLEDVGVCVDV
jgi:hypothetical protein